MKITYEAFPIWFDFDKNTLRMFSKLRCYNGELYPEFVERRKNNKMEDISKIIVVKDGNDIIAWAAVFSVGDFLYDKYTFRFMVYVRQSYRRNKIATHCYKTARKLIGKRSMTSYQKISTHVHGKKCKGINEKAVDRAVKSYYKNIRS